VEASRNEGWHSSTSSPMQTCEKGTICSIFLLLVLVYCIVAELALRLQSYTEPSERRGTQAGMGDSPVVFPVAPRGAFGAIWWVLWSLIPTYRRFTASFGGIRQSRRASLGAGPQQRRRLGGASRQCGFATIRPRKPWDSLPSVAGDDAQFHAVVDRDGATGG
jgi:hypothetical protein